MATLIIPGAVMVSLHYSVSGQELVNVIGLTGEILPPDTAANRVHDAWTKLGGPMTRMSSAATLTKVKATSLNTADGAVFERSASAVGGQSGTLASLATCAVIRVGAGTRSRSGKGRVYFGPLPASVMQGDGRQIIAAQATSLQTAFTQFRDELAAAGTPWVVLSRKLSSATPVESISVASVIGTQRRRLR